MEEAHKVVASHEEPGTRSRVELRLYDNRWSMVFLRPAAAGGWYVKDIIECPISDVATQRVALTTQRVESCGSNHGLALWVDPTAIREAYADTDDDPTVGMTDAALEAVGWAILEGVYDEYRRLLTQELGA